VVVENTELALGCLLQDTWGRLGEGLGFRLLFLRLFDFASVCVLVSHVLQLSTGWLALARTSGKAASHEPGSEQNPNLKVFKSRQIPILIRSTIPCGSIRMPARWTNARLERYDGERQESAMGNGWIVQKRHDMLTVVIYSAVGLIIVTVLVTLANYAMYGNSVPK
jgi:hypothetical protein